MNKVAVVHADSIGQVEEGIQSWLDKRPNITVVTIGQIRIKKKGDVPASFMTTIIYKEGE